MTSSYLIHCFNTSAKMMSPCGHPKETSTKSSPSVEGAVSGILAPWWTGRALHEVVVGRGEERGAETQLSLCPIKFEAGATHVDTSKQTKLLHFVEGGNAALVALESLRQRARARSSQQRIQKSRTPERTSETIKVTSPPAVAAAFALAVNASRAMKRCVG